MAMIRPENEMKDSGIEWVGSIPEDWKVAKNNRLFNISKEIVNENWKDTQLLSLTKSGIIEKNINDGGGKQPESFETYQYVEKDDIVLCLFDIDVSAVFSDRSKYDGMISSAYRVMKCTDAILSVYAKWWFDAVNIGRYYLIYTKSLRKTIDADGFGNILTVVPPLSEQQAIADYLDETCSKIDEIIAEAKASIDEYKELRIAAVNDAVTHGIHNNAIKDSNVDWIGKIPDNWKIIITKRLFKIKKDIAGKEGYTVLSITQKGIVPKVFGGKGQFAADYSNYQLVNKGDFAMNHMDLLTGWLDISEYDGVTSPDYRVFVPTGYEDIYAPYYKYVMQNCYSCRIYYGLGHGVAGMGRWRLPADMFLNFKLPMPPKAEQKEIADFLDKRTVEMDSLIVEKESLIADLEAYKKSLIYEVVTGKRRVV